MLQRGYTSVAKLIGFRSASDPAPGEKESLRFVFKVFDMPLNKLKYCTGSFVPPRLSFFYSFLGWNSTACAAFGSGSAQLRPTLEIYKILMFGCTV